MESAAFPDQEEAVGSFTSALSHTELHCSLLFHLCPSLSVSLSSSGNMERLLHICKWITLFVEILCVCVWILKNGEKGAPAIAPFFSSLSNPEEDKLWGTQRGSATDLLGTSTS